jgi:type VI secretion system protein ImpE
MDALQLISEGKLGAALSALQDQVRKDASNPKHRIFLFQLLAVLGQWNRALTQLNVAAELDAAALPMAQTYREAIQCEALRAEIFAGKRAPLIFGEPQPWLVLLLEALKREADGDLDGADLRDAVWTPVTFTWTNGASTVGLIPTRYSGTLGSTDEALLMSRRTEWVEDGPQAGHGLGQRMLVTDAADYALMDLRTIEFDNPVQAPQDGGIDG